MTAIGRMRPRRELQSKYGRLVIEALDRIASPQIRDEILDAAFGVAGSNTVLAQLQSALSFVSGPLHDVVAERLGPGEADALMGDLGPLLNRAAEHESGVRRSAKRRSSSRHLVPGEGPIAVVADDDPLVRASIDRVLRARGWRVLPADNGHLALGLCLKHGPDVVVSDWEMPALDGMQLAKAIVRSFGTNAPPFVLLSGVDVEGTPEGVACVLKKPFDPQDLVTVLDPLVQGPWDEDGDTD
jgi:CheY-like chemotaxis protein